MDFGEALNKLRTEGGRMTRHGWGGDQYVVYQSGYPDGIPINANTAGATGIPEGTVCVFSPYLMLHAGDERFVPWTASQIDLLADDWTIAP